VELEALSSGLTPTGTLTGDKLDQLTRNAAYNLEEGLGRNQYLARALYLGGQPDLDIYLPVGAP
jgi:hypothetical protein